eukprot:6476497-Amphidinium_carterae.1
MSLPLSETVTALATKVPSEKTRGFLAPTKATEVLAFSAARQFTEEIHLSPRFAAVCCVFVAPTVAVAGWLLCMFQPRNQHRSPVLRDPPPYSPGNEEERPFRAWIQDLTLWLLHSELEPPQQTAAIVAQLGGTARLLARELTPQELMHGGVVNGQHLDPVSYLVHALTARFAPLEDETRLRSTSALLGFTRNRGESIDSVLTRFELVRMRAQQEGGGALGLEP